ncbi:hypothetical protein PORY_001896 [Pneumocystis oryctolagi]|uniref:Uncharacterized protein n=1 Tax=Pneumocystis oryctolagi TaxID=42067 RepID=A0ACB7CBA4_9ASCO|nr:hypothetical protein PORY_001896 [Pneumocystis oryctolagi]
MLNSESDGISKVEFKESFKEQKESISSVVSVSSEEFPVLSEISEMSTLFTSTELVVVDLVMNDVSFCNASKGPSLNDPIKFVVSMFEIINIIENLLMKGLHTSTPFLKWGRHVYRGRWEDMVGTELIFRKSAELVGLSRRRLVMERVRLVNKHNDDMSIYKDADDTVDVTDKATDGPFCTEMPS